MWTICWTSSLGSIKCGVPQGSILGPLLFLLYIDDLSFVCKYTFPVPFSDDTNLFLSGKDVSSLSQMMTSELGKISEWLKVNKVSLSIKKIHYIVFSGGKSPPNALDIKIDNQERSRVLETKFLGVVFDNYLERNILLALRVKLLGVLVWLVKREDTSTEIHCLACIILLFILIWYNATMYGELLQKPILKLCALCKSVLLE